ncbi:hypothetical protein H2198_001924 [Neophaeococcomyces mojaviensis]|uniref:Uncharacterized protein n=1 Tax=Neophaeococcomyces mojaviensis TaxID=3383035 RepID=A0ACC3AFU2_9EURO|nr:hypothetical protein H2198_001924 [Knufia sp. JES_112]
MGDATENSQGKFVLYTNHGCPWAHRAHIALKELGLQYDETIIDLERPRDEWYLKINDRGLVPTVQHTHPTLSSNPTTIIESGLVVQYLIDAFPHLSSHIMPQAKDPKSAFDRYTINLLVDTWMTKINPKWFSAMLMTGTDDAATKADELFEAIKSQFEPMLAVSTTSGKGPFAGGSERLTLLEILTAPFVLRIHDFSNDTIHPASLGSRLDSLPAYSRWAKAVVTQDSVTYIWDKENMISSLQRRAPEMRKKFGVSK